MTDLRISRIHFPVTVLGPGRRLGIWMQGCHAGCSGCVSRDTWDPNGGHLISVDTLAAECRRLAGDELDGITITGGEPFEQSQELAAFLKVLAPWRVAVGFDILCYSGLSEKQLRRRHGTLLACFDALIPEPFIENRPTDLAWRGSDNQPLLIMSELGRQRYSMNTPLRQRLQFAVGENTVWFIGIPRHGDMERLRRLAEKEGLILEKTSWAS